MSATSPISRFCAVYLRISLDSTGEGLAVERQRQDCIAIAAKRGWTVHDIYIDNSVSASKSTVRRPQYHPLKKSMAISSSTTDFKFAVPRSTPTLHVANEASQLLRSLPIGRLENIELRPVSCVLPQAPCLSNGHLPAQVQDVRSLMEDRWHDLHLGTSRELNHDDRSVALDGGGRIPRSEYRPHVLQ